MNAVEDFELIRRCLEGEVDAFRGVVEKYQHKIHMLVFGITLDRDLADDLTQEVFIRAYQALPRFRAKSALYTWLYKIAFNLALDAKRKKKRWILQSLEEGTEAAREIPQPGWTRPDRQALREELRQMLDRGMGELTQAQRTVLVLREWESLSYQEIAAVMNCSVGTVMSRLHYAREKLRSYLKGYFQG